MYERIELDDLRNMADVSEKAKEFHMGTWKCGTAGCLVGTWCIAHPHDEMTLERDPDGYNVISPMFRGVSDEDAVMTRFGLFGGITGFLFVRHVLPRQQCPDAMDLSQSEAVARLRKYIAYVERKRALWAEHEWLMGLSRKDRRERMMQPIKV